MLDTLRRGAKTWVAKLLMALLVVSFGVWGIADVFRAIGTPTVAEVGSTKIELADFQRAYQRQVQAVSRQIGQPVDAELAAQFGLPQRVLDQLMSDAALSDAARDYGLGISDAALAKEIADDPSLRPPGASSFDRFYFNQLLQQNGMSEAQYVADRRVTSLRRQLENGLVGGVTTPTALVEALSRFRNEVRTVDYVTLPRSVVQPVPVPTDEQLTAWYDANKARFQAPEIRKVSIIAATPDTIADPAAVSDEDARKEYDRTKSQYVAAEQRRIQQILLPTIEDAAAAAEQIKAGKTFDALAAEKGLKPEDIDLGLMARDKVLDPAVAEAAFKLPLNEVSGPIGATFGGALIRVTEIVPEQVKPFDEVKGEIKSAIALRNAERQVLDVHDEVEDARAGGATLAEIAERFKMKLRTVEIDASGNGPDGAPVADLPEQEKLVAAAFATGEGDENDPIQAGRGFVWYAVDAVTPSRDRELAEVRDQVVAGWTDDAVDEALAARADEMVKAAKDGGDLAALATAAGLKVETTQAFARNGEVPALGAPGIDAAFSGPEGHVAVVEGPDGSRVVLKVKSAVVPPFFAEAADSVEAADRFRAELENSLVAQYIDELQKQQGTSVDQAMLNTAIGLNAR
jgi:peptidyl-prolyl cis-trans isomerase D